METTGFRLMTVDRVFRDLPRIPSRGAGTRSLMDDARNRTFGECRGTWSGRQEETTCLRQDNLRGAYAPSRSVTSRSGALRFERLQRGTIRVVCLLRDRYYSPSRKGAYASPPSNTKLAPAALH
jgi:hypothetical protein